MGLPRSYRGARARVTAVDDVSLELAAGENARDCRRIRQRQNHACAHAAALDRAGLGRTARRGPRFPGRARREPARSPARNADGVSGSVRLARSENAASGRLSSEPLEIHEPRLARAERRERVAEVLRAVGMAEDALNALPARIFRRPAAAHRHRARPGAAFRAWSWPTNLSPHSTSPSAHNLGACSKICQRDFALTYLLISHSLPVVRATRHAHRRHARRAAIGGETGPAAQILAAPTHPYTQSLIAAIPVLPASS